MSGEWIVPGFRHVRQLGDGASGLVMQAEHLETGTPVAIKYLSPQLAGDEDFILRFRQEAEILGSLTDPHLVRFHEYVESPHGVAIVMELVDGVSLAQLISAEGPTGPEAALFVLKGSLLGLAAAHAAGVVHRDYKPGNVLVDGEGNSKLADFGVAVRVGDNVPSAGTPAYMPPEQWGGRPVTPATDVYAATAVFYECLTGHGPYPSATLPQLALAHRTQPIPLTDVPDPLRPLVEHGMAKDVYDRPPSATAFLSELEAIAFAAYGVGWEERGRSKLKERAALLAMLFPLGGNSAPLGATAVATSTLAEADGDFLPSRDTDYGWDNGRRPRPSRTVLAAAAGIIAVVLIGGGPAAVMASSGGASTTASGPKTSAPPSVSAPASPGDTPTDTPTPAGTPTTTPTPTPAVPSSTPTPAATTKAPAPKTTSPKPKPPKSTPPAVPFAVTNAGGFISRLEGDRSGTYIVTIKTVGGPAKPVTVTITSLTTGLTSSAMSAVIPAGGTSASFTISGNNCMPWDVSASVSPGGFAAPAHDPGDSYPAVAACG